MPFDELIDGVVSLLSPSGVFSTIIPFSEEGSFIKLAASKGLFPKQITRVRGNLKTAIKRSLLGFERRESEIDYAELTIEIGQA